MDALSSQTNIAGYKAVLIAACHIEKYMPLLMTAAGTIPPAKVLVLGAGVAVGDIVALSTEERGNVAAVLAHRTVLLRLGLGALALGAQRLLALLLLGVDLLLLVDARQGEHAELCTAAGA